MAKEFKDFEKRWSRAQISHYIEVDGAWLFDVEGFIGVGLDINRWPYDMMSWNMHDIRHCVYEADDHEEWQMFRIALKRYNTFDKLCILHIRWSVYVYTELAKVTDWSDFSLKVVRERCRIENYINALKRGGQLDMDNRVAR